MIDPFHLEQYNIHAVNYNRDIELFPVLKSILMKITGKVLYYSPTDMGVNMIGNCVTSNEVLEDAGKKEIVRRFYNEMKNYKLGLTSIEIPNRIKMLMEKLKIDENYFDIISVAKEKLEEKNSHIVSLKLNSGKIITGKETELLSPSSSCIINAIKVLSNIPDDIKLLPKNILEPIKKTKNDDLHDNSKRLELSEVLIALSICSVTNPTVENALNKLKELSMCDAYATYIIPNSELKTLKKLDINIICEPKYYSDNDFIY